MIDDEMNIDENHGTEDSLESEISEKKLPISRVEELVKKAKLKGQNSMKDEIDLLKSEIESLKKSSTASKEMDYSNKIDLSDLDFKIEEAAERKIKEREEKQNQVNFDNALVEFNKDFNSKISTGKDKYPDFEKVVQEADILGEFPSVAFIANNLDNVDDVIYELSKNPMKAAQIDAILNKPNSKNALKIGSLEIKKISDYIKESNKSNKSHMVNQPVTRIQSSLAGADNRERTLEDAKSSYRF